MLYKTSPIEKGIFLNKNLKKELKKSYINLWIESIQVKLFFIYRIIKYCILSKMNRKPIFFFIFALFKIKNVYILAKGKESKGTNGFFRVHFSIK